MAVTEVKGKEVLLKQSPYLLFNAFTDLRNFATNLPAEMQGKVEVTYDTLVAEVQGIKMGVRVDDRLPYSQIRFKEEGQSPFPFTVTFHFEPVGLDQTLFHIEMRAEMNMMIKMMIGGKLKEMVDKLTDGIEQAASGKMPENMPQYS
ncbi:MAG: hypothetical protein J6U70_05875 [Bacteroidales bacterium]|jgi:carbon monoxide dehydrogenase subunit G|nr:hypothetical protein [Bacteroidales bacterium]